MVTRHWPCNTTGWKQPCNGWKGIAGTCTYPPSGMNNHVPLHTPLSLRPALHFPLSPPTHAASQNSNYSEPLVVRVMSLMVEVPSRPYDYASGAKGNTAYLRFFTCKACRAASNGHAPLRPTDPCSYTQIANMVFAFRGTYKDITTRPRCVVRPRSVHPCSFATSKSTGGWGRTMYGRHLEVWNMLRTYALLPARLVTCPLNSSIRQ
jgi:hypothetical protein